MRLNAVSIDNELRKSLVFREIEGKVLSVHDEAVYLRTDEGPMIVLAKAEVGNGPRFILVNDKASFKEQPFSIRPDDIFEACNGAVAIDGERIVIDPAGAKEWDSALVCLQPVKLSRVGRLIKIAMSVVKANKNKGGLQALLPSLDNLFLSLAKPKAKREGTAYFIYDRLLNFAKALSSGSETAIKKATLTMIGLGEGLTPSCDDMLVGVLGLLHCLKHSNAHASFAKRAISCISEAVERSEAKTNPISAHFLSEAAHGRFTERVKELFEAIFSDDDKRVETAAGRVLEYGATSGSDLICGIALTANAVVRDS